MSTGKYTIDMTSGSIFRKFLIFMFPLVCTYAMQSLFNAVDMIIVGRFCSAEALAAIGATLNPITLILKLFIGLATGVNAVIATYYGAKDHVNFHRGVHTAMAMAVYGGILLTGIAILVARPLLILMKTPDDILHTSCVYMQICFLGIPFLMIFNFGCALLRAVGDARRPLYYLMYAGVLNILLNLLFVLAFHMNVAGVAIATTISNGVATLLLMRTLLFSTDLSHVSLRRIRIHWQQLKEILWIGIPAAVNSTFFNIANMLIQSAINTFGSLAIAGCAAASTVESFVTLISMAAQQAAMTLVAQNFGAKQYSRVIRGCVICILVSAGFSCAVGWGTYWNGKAILGFFNQNLQVIDWGIMKTKIMLTTLFIGCMMDVSCGCLRGIGYSVLPAVSSFIGACLLRIIWVLWIFPYRPTLPFLMTCYPVSWILVDTFNCVLLFFLLKNIIRKEKLTVGTI